MSIDELETMELENGNLNAQNCALLLAQYLLAGDLMNGKLLWKRTPAAIKTESEEFGAIWAISKKLWAKDFQGFFALVKQRQWAEYVAPLITELINKTRQRVFRLACGAYTAMRAADFAAIVDLPVEEAIRLATNPENSSECLWHYDSPSQMLEKPWSTLVAVNGSGGNEEVVTADQHQRQFQTLTNYVSFLEN